MVATIEATIDGAPAPAAASSAPWLDLHERSPRGARRRCRGPGGGAGDPLEPPMPRPPVRPSLGAGGRPRVARSPTSAGRAASGDLARALASMSAAHPPDGVPRREHHRVAPGDPRRRARRDLRVRRRRRPHVAVRRAGPVRSSISMLYRTHRARRDQLRLLIADRGATPVAAAASYELPSAGSGSPVAVRRLAVGVEERSRGGLCRTRGQHRRHGPQLGDLGAGRGGAGARAARGRAADVPGRPRPRLTTGPKSEAARSLTTWGIPVFPNWQGCRTVSVAWPRHHPSDLPYWVGATCTSVQHEPAIALELLHCRFVRCENLQKLVSDRAATAAGISARECTTASGVPSAWPTWLAGMVLGTMWHCP